MPSLCHRVVSLDKMLCPTLSLSTQAYKWVPVTYCRGGNPAMECTGLRVHTVVERSWKVMEFEFCIPDLEKSWIMKSHGISDFPQNCF